MPTATGNVQIVLGTKAAASIARNFARLRRGFKSIGRVAMATFRKAFDISKYALGAGAAISVLAIRDAMNFSKAMDEVSTIVNTTTTDMGALTKEVLALSRATGKRPRELAKGLYQTISAGVTDSADAMKLLKVATRAAIAGVAEVPQAVNLLTNALNAYGRSVDDAGDISDVVFETVRLGKTTFGELADVLGRVLPLAASLKVDFRELNAATAALTLGGIKTDEAVTGLRAIMSSLIKVTPQAARQAKRLGIDFSAAAVKSKGFRAVLADIEKKAGGNEVALALMFGKVRGLVPIMALVGNTSKKYTGILGALKKAAGATDIAFDKIAMGSAFRIDKAFNALRITGIDLAIDTLPYIATGMEAVATWAKHAADRILAWVDTVDLAKWWNRVKTAAKETYDIMAPVVGKFYQDIKKWAEDQSYQLWWERVKIVIMEAKVAILGMRDAIKSTISWWQLIISNLPRKWAQISAEIEVARAKSVEYIAETWPVRGNIELMKKAETIATKLRTKAQVSFALASERGIRAARIREAREVGPGQTTKAMAELIEQMRKTGELERALKAAKEAREKPDVGKAAGEGAGAAMRAEAPKIKKAAERSTREAMQDQQLNAATTTIL